MMTKVTQETRRSKLKVHERETETVTEFNSIDYFLYIVFYVKTV